LFLFPSLFFFLFFFPILHSFFPVLLCFSFPSFLFFFFSFFLSLPNSLSFWSLFFFSSSFFVWGPKNK
jgi:hypothetical protein